MAYPNKLYTRLTIRTLGFCVYCKSQQSFLISARASDCLSFGNPQTNAINILTSYAKNERSESLAVAVKERLSINANSVLIIFNTLLKLL
jgi:hypothetical protein